jgi:hypothetical protein
VEGGGVGGSEEAAIFIAKALAQRGDYHVEVYADSPDEQLGRQKDGVVWHKFGWYVYHRSSLLSSQSLPSLFPVSSQSLPSLFPVFSQSLPRSLA